MDSKPLPTMLRKYAQKRTKADGTQYFSLSHQDAVTIADRSKKSLREIEIAALENDILPERYCRNQQSLNNRDQIRLLKSHVAVIGQGGLGGTVTEILARIGIGRLTLVDADIFEESNLNRQLLSTVDALGTSKVEAGKRRVQSINPAIEVTAITSYLNSINGVNILSECKLAVDCLDSIPSRFDLEEACQYLKIPLVSAAIAGSTGQAMVVFPGDDGLRLVYGEAQKAAEKGVETRLGTLPYTAVLMAAVECAEVVEIICKQSSSLQNNMLLVDIKNKNMEKIMLSG
jgi:molybdopterin/thiamine biosynthesis adenylyltransferase